MKVLCITDPDLLSGRDSMISKVKAMSAAAPFGIILREKELSDYRYSEFFLQVKALKELKGTRIIWHDHLEELLRFIKRESSYEYPDAVLLSYSEFEKFRSTSVRRKLKTPGISFGRTVHNSRELDDAERYGASFILASNIFETTCKPGAAPRGISFLKEVCDDFPGPVYALGGIDSSNASECTDSGAAGVAVRSLCMNKNLNELEKLTGL